MLKPSTHTVVFIHGAWMTPACWDDFKRPFAAAGFTVHAPTWPCLDDRPAAAQRASPLSGLGGLSVGRIVDHYQGFIAGLPESPLLVGHSFGGLFTQLLLDRGCGAAGIAIDPGPIGGIIPGPVSLAAAWPIVARWNAWNRPFTLSPAAFAATFANTASPAVQREAYERLVVPTSGRIFCQAALSLGTFVSPPPPPPAAADRRRRAGPHGHAVPGAGRLPQAAEIAGAHRFHAIFRPLPLPHRRAGLGAGRGPRRSLGAHRTR